MSIFIHDFSLSHIQYFNHYFFDSAHVFYGHRHDTWEINVVLDGQLEVTYDDTVFTLKANQAFIGEPNVFHRNHIAPGHTAELIVIHFTSHELPLLYLSQIFALSDENLILFKLALSDFEQFRVKHQLTSHTIDLAPASFKKLLEVFIGRIVKESVAIPYSNTKETLIYNQAVAYMKENLHRSCPVLEIATACCVCSTTLKNIFRTYTGQGVNTFFMNMKLEESKRYLQQNNTLSTISERLGFTSQAYFSRSFKKAYGCSPLHYKTQYLKGL
ncbi:MAG: AraC family transcriptional regulator [Niameybacter sp.]